MYVRRGRSAFLTRNSVLQSAKIMLSRTENNPETDSRNPDFLKDKQSLNERNSSLEMMLSV